MPAPLPTKKVTNEHAVPWTILEPTDEWIQRTVLIYGQSGTGKTKLAGEFLDPLFLSCDPGKLGGALTIIDKKVKHIKITSYSQLMDLIPTLTAEADKGSFKTIVLDSISYLSSTILRDILKQSGREIPRFEEWNLNATRMRTLINSITSINSHIVFTAVEQKDKDEITGKISGEPKLPGQLATELPQACDITVRLYTTTSRNASTGKLQVNYKFRSVPDEMWFAKDRTNTLPPEGDTDYKYFKPLFD